MTKRRIVAEHRRLRKAQAARVMPIIGPLLDAWEGVPNDLRFEIEEHAGELAGYLDEIEAAMEDA